MPALHKNRVKMTVTSVASSGLGTITLNAASSGYQSFATAYGADATVDILITEGTSWEVARDCTYTHSGTTVTRGTLEASSTGSAVAFTSAAIVSVMMSAYKGDMLERQINRSAVMVKNNGSTTQTLDGTPAAWAVVSTALTTVSTDPMGWWNTSTKQFLPTWAGTYLVNVGVQLDGSATSGVQCGILKNGSIFAAGPIVVRAAGYPAMVFAFPVALNGSSDYLTSAVYLDGYDYTTHAYAEGTYFSAIYLGP